MARLTAYETYCIFIALKTHFTVPTYDYFKYNGKTARVSMDAFMARKDRLQFQRLCRMCDASQMQDFIVANLAKGMTYAVELTSDQAEDNYQEYMKRKQSFSYVFSNEIDRLFNLTDDPADLFRRNDGRYPVLINEYLSSNVSLESICVLNEFVRFDVRLDQRLGSDDVIWSKMRLLIKKFTPFIEYDREKIRNILKRTVVGKSSRDAPTTQVKHADVV